MAMYYYASKLNEASCSGCNVKLPPPPSEPAPPPPDQPTLPTDPELLHGPALSYYDSDSYYSLERINNCTSENSKCLVMNGSIGLVSSKPLETELVHNAKAAGPYDRADIEFREDGQVAAASLDGLIELLRRSTIKPLKPYVFSLILCVRLYIKPHELLTKLYKRFLNNNCVVEVSTSAGTEVVHKELADMMAFVRILKHWTTMIPNDFRDENATAMFRNITERCAAEHMAPMNSQVSAMLEKLVARVKAVREYEESLVEVPRVPHVDQLPMGDIITLGLTPAELAQELSTIELYKLSFVGPEEFVQAFVPVAPPVQTVNNVTIIPVEANSTKCLEAYANWFNRLTYLVATDILKAVKSKYRARVIEQWVMTARECFNLGNFNSLMAIVGALNMPPIRRLKKTWSRTSAVCGQQLRQLELCVEPSANHARYRAALAAAPEMKRVPLLSVTCRDLHFVNQASPTKLSGNLINFEKCMRLAQRVSAQLPSRRLMSVGTNPPPAPPRRDTPVWRFLTCRPALTEHAMELTSFECEPPVDQHEKERLKRLRVAT